MGAARTITAEPDAPRGRALTVRLVLLALWAAGALFLAWHHVPWRDEVRALTIALSGDTTLDMLRNLQGEGHPALWYLLLRWGHALIQSPLVLPITAFALSAATMAVLALKSPLRLATTALFMFGGLGLFEYTVSARNYGMSALVLFVFAWLYPRWRDRGIVLGLVIVALCNTNVPANFLGAALVGFWLLDIFAEEGFRWSRKYGWWAANAALALGGAILCFITVYPTVHDAASIDHPDGFGLATFVAALVGPTPAFPDLGAPLVFGPWSGLLLTILILGSLAGLLRAPAAFLAAAGVLLFFKLFFLIVYPGGYRHQGLLVAFLLTLYWLVALGHGGRWPKRWQLVRKVADRAARIGGSCFVALLAVQLIQSAIHLSAAVQDVPYSRTRDLASLLEREGLTDATIIAHPDVFAEPLPYYAGNPVWLLREQKYGKVVRFTNDARTELSLDEVLADALRIRGESGRPVVILMKYRLDPAEPPRVYAEGYLGNFTIRPDQERRFLAATRLLTSFGPAITDESYDVYLLTGG